MRIRHIIIMLAILMALGATYLFETKKEKKKNEMEQKSKKVFIVDKLSINAIELKYSEDGTVRVEKNPDWKITKPVEAKVDSLELEKYITAIDSSYFSRKIDDETHKLEEFGLDKPKIIITVEGGSSKEQLLIGSPAVVGFGYYAMKGTSVYLLDDNTVKDLSKDLFSLRFKRLTELKPQDLEEVIIKGPSFELSLKKEEGIWKGVDGIDSDKVETLLGRLIWTNALKVAKEKMENPDEFGLAEPQLTVLIRGKQGEDKLILGVRGEDGRMRVYATSESIGHIFLMPEWLAQHIPKKAEELLKGKGQPE